MSQDTYYRAELKLTAITPGTPDSNGYRRNDSDAVAEVTVTAGSAGSAMSQITEHVRALTEWHYDPPTLEPLGTTIRRIREQGEAQPA